MLSPAFFPAVLLQITALNSFDRAAYAQIAPSLETGRAERGE